MPNFDKMKNMMAGGGADAPEAGGPKAPPSMELDMEKYRERVAAIPPDAKTDLILDLFQNVTTEEIDAALNEYTASQPPAAPGAGVDEPAPEI